MFPVVAEKDRKPNDFIGDVQFSPDGHLLYAADLYHDSVVVVNPQSGLVISRIKTGRRPYRILFHPSGKSFYVSSWADGSIGQYDTNTGNLLATTRVGAHTTDMVWREGTYRRSAECHGPAVRFGQQHKQRLRARAPRNRASCRGSKPSISR